MLQSSVTILFIGDVVGVPGRMMVQKYLPKLKKEQSIDFVIVNGENSAGKGRGITPSIAKFFKHVGADVITTGNHIWAHKEIMPYLDQDKTVLRPANFPTTCPGSGLAIVHGENGVKVAVINVQGRVFMKEHLDCPFKTVESLIMFARTQTPIIIVDIHAEATSEKMGLAYHFDGKVSAVLGTHTHVPTADERILPQSTGYISDVGMVGAFNSMLGMKKGPIIANFLHQMPTKFEVETEGPFVLWAVVLEIDRSTGKTTSIKRVKIVDETLIAKTKDKDFAD